MRQERKYTVRISTVRRSGRLPISSEPRHEDPSLELIRQRGVSSF